MCYSCVAVHVPLLERGTKVEIGCDCPSFDASIPGSVEYIRDKTLGIIRTEIVCANCGSHLGHVFDDAPTDTGQRYCVNSVSIDFKN